MKRTYAKLGGQLGLGCIAVGLLVIGLGWNGASSVDFAQGQIPYLLSGGALGLAIVGLGVGLLVIDNNRRNRVRIEAQLRELNAAISRLAAAVSSGGMNGHAATNGGSSQPGGIVLGRSTFHRPDCRLALAKDLPEGTVDGAVAAGLTPCRICNPADLHALEPTAS